MIRAVDQPTMHSPFITTSRSQALRAQSSLLRRMMNFGRSAKMVLAATMKSSASIPRTSICLPGSFWKTAPRSTSRPVAPMHLCMPAPIYTMITGISISPSVEPNTGAAKPCVWMMPPSKRYATRSSLIRSGNILSLSTRWSTSRRSGESGRTDTRKIGTPEKNGFGKWNVEPEAKKEKKLKPSPWFVNAFSKVSPSLNSNTAYNQWACSSTSTVGKLPASFSASENTASKPWTWTKPSSGNWNGTRPTGSSTRTASASSGSCRMQKQINEIVHAKHFRK